MINMLRTYLTHNYYREDGATAVEYGIMVALIAAVIIGAVIILGETLLGVFQGVNSDLGDATTG